MKKIVLMVLVSVLVLTAAISACGGAKEEVGGQGTQEGEQTSATIAKTTKPVSGGDGGWGDMPIYPGAVQVEKYSSEGSEDGQTTVLETRLYETDAGISDVGDFYQDKMPDNGWQKLVWAETGTGHMGQFQKDDFKYGANIGISQNPDGVTVISLVKSSIE